MDYSKSFSEGKVCQICAVPVQNQNKSYRCIKHVSCGRKLLYTTKARIRDKATKGTGMTNQEIFNEWWCSGFNAAIDKHWYPSPLAGVVKE